MIKDECFSKKWLDSKRNQFPDSDPGIMEKSIYALELVGNLRTAGLDFIFKGGTSLLLLLEEPKRLSIDVDILTKETKEKIEKALAEIVKSNRFISWEEDPRTESSIPKKHYKLFFNSVINPGSVSYILLDVLFGASPYAALNSIELNSSIITIEEKVTVNVPTLNGLLGDKLTAFASNTTGIPYGVGKEMEINKQLFDIGIISRNVDNISEIETAFSNCVDIQAEYRKKDITKDQVTKDLFELSFLISQIRLKKSISNEITEEFESGINKLQNHLLVKPYNLGNAKIYASRCALIISLFGKKEKVDEKLKYEPTKITDSVLKEDLTILNRLKPVLPEAFYSWQQVQNLR
ncbi:MAG: nucleotidyl transferase AbiEii/AbiGii toxin family protein [Bacteroidetes bacterium]|nr:nucleotidyl transferase AbiEii/AbiGii toxin family protein [Bacteroidota bacterium]